MYFHKQQLCFCRIKNRTYYSQLCICCLMYFYSFDWHYRAAARILLPSMHPLLPSVMLLFWFYIFIIVFTVELYFHDILIPYMKMLNWCILSSLTGRKLRWKNTEFFIYSLAWKQRTFRAQFNSRNKKTQHKEIDLGCTDHVGISNLFWFVYLQQCKVQKGYLKLNIDWRVWGLIIILVSSLLGQSQKNMAPPTN